jgi:hypothetical protein
MAIPQWAVYELRQYTLHPGTRDEFVRLFERHLLETQDAAGMRVLGQFCDGDRPDVFVWMRAFPDMEQRRKSLTAFYYGPVWAAYRAAANAMMIDSDDVLLLEPACAGRLLSDRVGSRPPLEATAPGATLVEVTICPVRPADAARCVREHVHGVIPLQRASGADPLPPLQTLRATNTFPQLPVHEDRHVVVTMARFAEPAAAERLVADPAYRSATDRVATPAVGPVQRLRLTPTPRSALR